MGTGHRKLGRSVLIAYRLAGCSLVAVLATQPVAAATQEDAIAPGVPQSGSQNQAENSGDDYVKPLNIFQLFSEYKTNPGTGSAPGTIGQVTRYIVNLRADHRIDFASQWALGLRADLPFLTKNSVSSGNPDGNYLSGVGDADFQAALLHTFDTRWSTGFGARLIAPSGGDNLGSGKWQIMPGFAVRYALSEAGPGSYFEPLVRYDISFAGDPSKKNISNLQFAPGLNLGLPERWFVTLYPSPDIRVNYGAPVTGQTGRLFLPFDFKVGRKLNNDLVLSLEVSVPIIKDYPVYDFKTEVRLSKVF